MNLTPEQTAEIIERVTKHIAEAKGLFRHFIAEAGQSCLAGPDEAARSVALIEGLRKDLSTGKFLSRELDSFRSEEFMATGGRS